MGDAPAKQKSRTTQRLDRRRRIPSRCSPFIPRQPVTWSFLTLFVLFSTTHCFAAPPQLRDSYGNESAKPLEEPAKADILSKKFAPSKLKSKASSTSKKINRREKSSGMTAVQTILGLSFVLCLIWVTAAWAKKHLPNLGGNLPSEAVQILGQKVLGQRQSIQLIRCGSRILIVGSTAQGLTTLSEITDPVEVDYLAGLCRQDQPNSVTSAFSQLFQNYRESSTKQVLPTAENSLKERLGRFEEEHPTTHAVSEQAHG